MITTLPNNTTVFKVCTCYKVGTFFNKFFRFQSLPSNSTFHVKVEFHGNRFPVARYLPQPLNPAVLICFVLLHAQSSKIALIIAATLVSRSWMRRAMSSELSGEENL